MTWECGGVGEERRMKVDWGRSEIGESWEIGERMRIAGRKKRREGSGFYPLDERDGDCLSLHAGDQNLEYPVFPRGIIE